MAKEFTLKGVVKFLDAGASQVIKKIDKNVTGLRKNTQRMKGGFRDFNQGLAVMGGAGVIVGAGFAKAIQTSAQFEQQMARVGALARSSDSDLKLLTMTAKKFGATTEFTATQAGQGLEFLALASFNAQDSVKVLPVILDTAAAGALDLGRASDIVTDSMSSLGTAFDKKFSTPVQRATRLADVMALAQSRSNMNIEQMGEAIKFGGGALAGFGIPMTQIIASMGKLADSGLKGSLGGTALTNMFNKLTKPSKDVSNAMRILGVDMNDLPLNDIAATTGILGTALDKITDPVQRQTVAIAVFGQRGIRAFNALKNAGPAAIRTLTKELEDSEGSAKKIATRMRNTFEGQTKSFKSAVEGVLIEVGDFFTKNKKDVLPAFKSLVSFVQALGQAFQFVNMSTKDQGKAIGGMSDQVKTLIQFAQGFKEGISEAFQVIRQVLKKVQEAFKGIIPEGEDGIKMVGKWIAKGALLLTVMAPLLIGFVAFSFAISSVAGGFFGLFNMVRGGLGIFTNMFGIFKKGGGVVFSLFKKVGGFKGILSGLGSVFKFIGPLAGKMFGIMKFAIMGVGKALLFLATNPIGMVIVAIGLLVAAGFFLWKNWDSVTAGITASWEFFTGRIMQMWDELGSFFKNASIGEIIIKTLLFPLRAALTPLANLIKLIAKSGIAKKLLGDKAKFIEDLAANVSLIDMEPTVEEKKRFGDTFAAEKLKSQSVEAKTLSMPQSAEPQVNITMPEPNITLVNENTTVVDGAVIEKSMTKRKIDRTQRAGMNATNPKNMSLAKSGGFSHGFAR